MSTPSYGYLLRKFGLSETVANDADLVSVPLGFVKLMLQYVVSAEPFSEEKYLAAHDDVARDVASGAEASGARHYLTYGYFENRANPAIAVDEKWYLGRYPNVANEMRLERIASPREHFERRGKARGYAPNAAAFEVYQLWERMLERSHLAAKAVTASESATSAAQHVDKRDGARRS